VLEWVFQPLSGLLVPALARLRVPPPAVVLANAVTGLLAALAIADEELIAGALLLQLKTLLDNCDGRLARATGRVTLAGRYLDTVADLVVNAGLFLALADVTGEPLLALAAFVALTFVLAVDFNVSELASEVHGVVAQSPQPTDSGVERLLGSVYTAVFGTQDRVVRAISNRRFESSVGSDASAEVRRAYFDPVTLAALANLGLTTQLAVLGTCLLLGMPTLYLWLVLASLVVLAALQLRREHLARRAAEP
jgi:phosphatidylglycerophosphate synthase